MPRRLPLREGLPGTDSGHVTTAVQAGLHRPVDRQMANKKAGLRLEDAAFAFLEQPGGLPGNADLIALNEAPWGFLSSFVRASTHLYVCAHTYTTLNTFKCVRVHAQQE